MRASEIVHKASRLKTMFDQSGGGVTVSGGELTMQAEFAAAVLRGCKDLGIHTAIETCGASSWEKLEVLADLADLILYDIKLMDDAEHRRWTGASNGAILSNAARLAERRHGKGIQVRIPLIPGVTDTEQNLRATFEFMAKVGLPSVALLPYNPAAGAKYEWLDREYPLDETVPDATPQAEDALDAMVAMARGYGLTAVID